MPRRARRGIGPLQVLGVVLLVAVLGAAAWGLLSRGGDPFANVTDLDVSDYLENANSLRGNVYKVRGTVDEQLKWTPDGGRLFSVEVGKEDGRDGDLVPVMIPEQFSSQNIQQSQSFRFKVEVGTGGLLIAQAIEKT